jgi:hypothetical protein
VCSSFSRDLPASIAIGQYGGPRDVTGNKKNAVVHTKKGRRRKSGGDGRDVVPPYFFQVFMHKNMTGTHLACNGALVDAWRVGSRMDFALPGYCVTPARSSLFSLLEINRQEVLIPFIACFYSISSQNSSDSVICQPDAY